MPDRTCTIDGCTKTATKRGWCPGHYWRWKQHGDPTAGGTAKGALSAFIAMAAASDTNDCILWPFATTEGGYGVVRALGTTAHRAVLEAATSPAPGMDAAHAPLICHNRLCVNPRHLRWATRPDNLADTVPDDTHRRGERVGQIAREHLRLRAQRVRDRRALSRSSRGRPATSEL